MTESLAGGALAAPLSMRAAANITSAVVRAARQLLTDLERDRRIDAGILRSAVEAGFGASDADGAWTWKTAYDACEAAIVLFLRKFDPARRTKAGSRENTSIRLLEGVLFTTYATLRTDERGEKLSRVKQIIEWLSSDFDRMIVKESHAGKTIFELAEGLQLRGVVMSANRIELSGFKNTMLGPLKAYGLFHEITSWKLCMFMPANATGPGILAPMLERYRLTRVSEREAA
ncbi:strawberry notch family protein [Bradyrhizobium sp. UFLA05-109]